MLKLTQFLIIFYVGSIASVKDIPGIKAKICDSATRKNKIFFDQQEAERKTREIEKASRAKKQVELIDEVIDEITDFFINPPERDGPSVSALICYDRVIIKKMELEKLFDYNDIVEILEMLVENNFLTKTPGGLLGFASELYKHKQPLLVV